MVIICILFSVKMLSLNNGKNTVAFYFPQKFGEIKCFENRFQIIKQLIFFDVGKKKFMSQLFITWRGKIKNCSFRKPVLLVIQDFCKCDWLKIFPSYNDRRFNRIISALSSCHMKRYRMNWEKLSFNWSYSYQLHTWKETVQIDFSWHSLYQEASYQNYHVTGI